ncbi:sugar ABC transporter substrate-binding protein [Paenibacillus sp. BIHB 4019]|uniref:Sugar ABC transporter substrate-binding protein n=1 Tax=Paenibacillus sp. BIHB 4019 TaxID=1870819 RepID=A0A1B2DT56_9BACL|nr:sugar ABC transporter substrate-binding protein [Paenibacillus sp. BIHB 4019]ANY70899.1 sugar ABC transporter substrate-binding protein [Paenibacillus sp. BIHB 4019]
MKKSSRALLSILPIAIAVGCSSTNSGNVVNNGTEQKEDIELTFLMWGNQGHMDVYSKLIAGFKQENPGIQVVMESVPFADYQQKISVLAAGRTLPDIAWVSERMIPQFKANGILADVSEFKNDADFKLGDYIPSTLDLFRDGEQLLGLPFSTPPVVMFYNKTLFDQAKLLDPNTLASEGKWTWEQFVQSAKAISSSDAKSRIYGANFFRDWKTWAILSSYSWSNGSGPFNADLTAFTWNDQYGLETFDMLSRMMFTDQSHPKAGEQVSFDAGNVGMFFDNYSYVSKAREITSFEWSIAPMPSGSQGSVPMLGQAGYTLFKDSKHPEEAKKLLKYFASQAGIEATATYFVPPRTSVLQSDAFLHQPNNPPAEHITQAVIDEMPKARMLPGHIRWQDIDNAVLQGFDRLFGRSGSTQENLAKMQTEVDAILK